MATEEEIVNLYAALDAIRDCFYIAEEQTCPLIYLGIGEPIIDRSHAKAGIIVELCRILILDHDLSEH